MPNTFFIPFRKNKICVHTFGSGRRLMIAFHGFKENGSSLSILEKSAGEKFTIYAPDLPFHGNTEWNDFHFTMEDLSQLITELLHYFGTNRFSLLGYSMGGRVALCAATVSIQHIDSLILLAPDGLHENFWYYFVTQTKLGHALFRKVTYHPAFLHFIIETGYRLHLTNESVYKFTRLHTDSLEQREFVYQIWTCMKSLSPDIRGIKKLIRNDNLPLIIFMGRFDRIITPNQAKVFKGVPNAKIRIVGMGHQLLKQEIADEIFRYLTQKNHSS